MEREIRIETPEGSMKTFLVGPDGAGPFPVGVIYMDAPGYREQLRHVARRYAQGGYLVVVPDLYHASGDDLTVDIPKLMQEGMEGPEGERMFTFVRALTPARGASYTQAILGRLRHEPAANDGPRVCVGFCMGARHVVHTLTTFPDQFAAGCGIHPGPLVNDTEDSPHRELGRVRGELYLAFAEEDEASSPEQLAALEAEAERSGVSLSIEVYPGTRHGFAMADIPVYSEADSERHFAKTLEVWDRNAAAEPAAR